VSTTKKSRRPLVYALIVIFVWFGTSGVMGPLFGFNDSENQSLPTLVLYRGEIDAEKIAGLNIHLAQLASKNIGDSDVPISAYLNPGEQIFAFPSQDGKALLVNLPFNADVASDLLPNNKPVLPELIETLREDASEYASSNGLISNVTGIGAILGDLFGAFEGIDSSLLFTTLIVVALILIVVYRSPVLWILPLFSAVIALSTAGGLIYLLTKNDVIDLNGQSQGILSVLVLGAATDYALLLIARYREELHHFDTPFSAMKAALKGVVEPIVASGATTTTALMVLLLSDLSGNRGLGPVGAIGIICSVITILTLLPALLVAFGRWVFWPRIPDAFTQRPDSVVGLEFLGQHFPGGSGQPTEVVVKQELIAPISAALMQVDGVASVEPLRSAPAIPGQPPAEIKIVDGRAVLNATLSLNPDSVEARDVIPKIRDAVHAIDPEILVGGSTAVAFDTDVAANHDNRTIIPIVLILITIILGLLLRSILAAGLLLGTVVLSYFATLGACQLVFEHIFGFKGADVSFPLFAFIFLVALGIDYNIFLMTRVREESARIGTRAGVIKGLTVTGGVITSAGIVLAATFGVLGVLPLVFLAQLGFAVAFGVLLDTMIVRTILVPALVHDIGGKVWWPSKLQSK